jgi:hypothetical protein
MKQPSMTVVQPSPTTTQTSPSPPESPQQIEDTVYQAFVRQWYFAHVQAPGPTVGASLVSAAVAQVGGMVIVMDMV